MGRWDKIADKEKRILLALADMYGQYCSGRFGHDFMSAGENACEILDNYGLMKLDDELDEDAVEKLRLSL